MANFSRNFLAGRMNKVTDQRVLPDGEYIDAMNIRMGSTENAEVGVIENTKGNLPLTTPLTYIDGTTLSINARCIGAIEDSANETIYWFVHDPEFGVGATGKLDLILSINVLSNILTYHVISIDNTDGVDTTLNFNPSYLITGVSLIENLIFFTDNYNPPRFFNINRNYANPIGNVDQISAESLLVIKKPPTESPSITPIITSGQQNFLETRFISFAYRYKYVDGEYSATSQWSEPAFIPNSFNFSINSMLNEGMVNSCNTVIINYNSGGPLVVGIDLLFKESNKNIIKIIEKLNKSNLGLANNNEYQYSFDNSKIFTVLNEAEILRLYDNVPRLAQAQTIMGNRLMYGNYIEGYDLIDKNGSPIKLEYFTSLTSENIGQSSVSDSTASGVYNIDPSAINTTVANSVLNFDLVGKPLISGSSIVIKMNIQHSLFTGPDTFPTETTGVLLLNFTFYLTRDFSSVYDLATSAEFTQAVGTVSNIKPVIDSCSGTTFTDQVNCLIANNLDGYTKFGSGINAILQPIKIITTPASTTIGFQFPAMEYIDGTEKIYEYYQVTSAVIFYQKIANPSSLHSNRGYEVGIVYMDEFNRATTTLVSPTNTQFIPCSASSSKNTIQVTIPATQHPPAWAKRYKFVIKPDAENYETIYSNIFFTDSVSNNIYFLLEGENMQKVENGDRLIVKADTSGPTTSCTYATVLEKKAQGPDFIIPKEDIPVLSGVYMKMNPNSFNVVVDPNATIAPGNISLINYYPYCINLEYPMNLTKAAGYDPLHPLWEYEDYSVPSGSRIKIYSKAERPGTSLCFGVLWEVEFISSRDYDNMYDWFVGDNVSATLSNPNITLCGESKIEFTPNFGNASCSVYTMGIQFNRDIVTNRLWLNYSIPRTIGFKSTTLNVNIQVFRAINTIIWETRPSDALPDIFFENNLSFAINKGYHEGNIRNQKDDGTPAIVDTGFYNCYSFGNGAESYKIRDSILGRSFNLGERVTTVAAQDYKEAHKFSDITYSGIYNGESNINRLNEFNKGLSNFKHCESSFGNIMLLDGRNTDVLTLQEDKISYVLAGKNLLSDASAGGIITATPEVLGTQIARTEKYGISFNPESYVQWGYDRFFTDAKRGAVIQLKGGEDQNEQLVAISNQNMRTWFRDKFNDSFNTQKLGGFDPYMNEYVLSMNEQLLPINPQCIPCGVSQTFTLTNESDTEKILTYCVDLGPNVGYTNFNWSVVSCNKDPSYHIFINYNGTIYERSFDCTNEPTGTISFNKDTVNVETAQITITYKGSSVISFIADCCNAEALNIIEVVLTNNSQAGQTVHTQYRYTNGTFVGPLLSNLVQFIDSTSSPTVSRYNITSGFAGQGGFPPEYSTMRLISNSISPDDFVFNTDTYKFRYFRSNDLYENNNIAIQALIALSDIATPNSGLNPTYYADFTVPASSNGNNLYLIWDFRDAIPTTLCFGTTRVETCCNCASDLYYLDAAFNVATSVWTTSNLDTFASNGFYSLGGIVRELVDGVLLPQQTCLPCAVAINLCFGATAVDVCCNCSITCSNTYNSYLVTNGNVIDVLVYYYDENGILHSNNLPASATDAPYCSIGEPFSDYSINVTFDSCGCLG